MGEGLSMPPLLLDRQPNCSFNIINIVLLLYYNVWFVFVWSCNFFQADFAISCLIKTSAILWSAYWHCNSRVWPKAVFFEAQICGKTAKKKCFRAQRFLSREIKKCDIVPFKISFCNRFLI